MAGCRRVREDVTVGQGLTLLTVSCQVNGTQSEIRL